jgi:pimeloyl-ACP methyl ester carboxylesterase
MTRDIITLSPMPLLNVNDLSLHYEESGSGTPVLLIHGHPFDCSMWRPQLAAGLPARLIAPDLRNFGRTTSLNGPAGWSTYAEDMLAFASALGLHRFAVAGLSMGGQIALEIAALAPERVLGLALCDTFAQLDTPQKNRGRLDQATRFEREGMRGYATEVLPRMFFAKSIETKPELAKELVEMMERCPPQGAADAARARTARRDYLPLLPALKLPVTVVVGEHDAFTPVPDAELMHHAIADSTLVVVEDAGHIANLEQPEIFNRALGSWLAAIQRNLHLA